MAGFTGSPATISQHAYTRLAQRGLSPAQLDYVLQHGTLERRTGVVFRILRDRDIPAADRRDDRLTRLAGTIALVGERGRVITVFRRREDAVRYVRKLPKYRQAA